VIMRRIFLLFNLILMFSCGGSKRISNTNLAYRYSPGINFIFPNYTVYNLPGDTSRLFFRIDPSQLLFKNNDSLTGFTADYSVAYALHFNFDSKLPIDTGERFFNQEKVDDSNFRIVNYIDFKAPTGADYILEVTFTDLNRNQAVSDFLTVDRTGYQSPNNFMVIDRRRNQPLVTGFCDRPTEFMISYNNDSVKKPLYMRYFKNDYPLSPPPFSNDRAKLLSYSSDQTTMLDLNEDNRIKVTRPGIYHFQFDTMVKEGYTFFYFEEDFPNLTNAESLIESIRYLTTREEFSKILSSKDRKQAVDDFWLKLGGNRERARILIKNYYSRVQYANRFFTSYYEGWKTDRGLIYIIFGPPASVYRTDVSESWNYSSNSYYGSLTFTFDKLSNPFTDNDFTLRRSNYFEIPWYKAVDSWRDGRVVNDNY